MQRSFWLRRSHLSTAGLISFLGRLESYWEMSCHIWILKWFPHFPSNDFRVPGLTLGLWSIWSWCLSTVRCQDPVSFSCRQTASFPSIVYPFSNVKWHFPKNQGAALCEFISGSPLCFIDLRVCLGAGLSPLPCSMTWDPEWWNLQYSFFAQCGGCCCQLDRTQNPLGGGALRTPVVDRLDHIHYDGDREDMSSLWVGSFPRQGIPAVWVDSCVGAERQPASVLCCSKLLLWLPHREGLHRGPWVTVSPFSP